VCRHPAAALSPTNHRGHPIRDQRPRSDRGVPLRSVHHGLVDQVHCPVHGRARRPIHDQRRRSRLAPVNPEPYRLFCRKAPELLLITKMPFQLQRSLQFSPGFHVEAPELLCFIHPLSKPCSFTPKPLSSYT
jgi:hypothetical protein